MKAVQVILLNEDHERVAVLNVPAAKVSTAAIVRWEGRHFVFHNHATFQLGFAYYVEVDPPVDLTQESRL